MKYEAVIGLEVHAQLKTRSKIFCSCPTDFGGTPNDHVCPVCLGMPGVLPVLNRVALEYAVRAGLALNCEISEHSKFDRKNYFYPDLPKAYQISQFDQPICKSGYLEIKGKKIRIHRAHLEEDAGKLVHAGAAGLHGSDYSLVDYNRCGVPLLEIVSEPDIESPEEARLYLAELRNILRYVGVCDGNLEEGSFRCDANVSLRPLGQKELGTKAEIKNMNSFRSVQRAIQSEIERQTQLLDGGERVKQETRLWNEATGQTHPMRSKEEAHDYRYFPEPDLVPLAVDRAWVDNIKKALPELPETRRKRYLETHGLSVDEAYLLVEVQELGDWVDNYHRLTGAPLKPAVKLLLGPGLAYLNEAKVDIGKTSLSPQSLRHIVDEYEAGRLNSSQSKEVLLELLSTQSVAGDNANREIRKTLVNDRGELEVFLVVASPDGKATRRKTVYAKDGSETTQESFDEYVCVSDVISAATIIKEKGLTQLSDESGIRAVVEKVLADNPGQLADYKAGKTKVRQYFFGETMKATKGKGNPQVINKLLDQLLAD